MKNLFLLIIFKILCSVSISAQKQKDTLYFKLDKNYTFFVDDFEELTNYREFENKIIKNIFKTKTDGYFYFKKIDTLYNLNPKKILSLKEYIENREFYYPGNYNRIVNTDILKKELFNYYKIFIVEDNKYIEIRQHPYENFYSSYYPIKYQDEKKYPKQVKDTFFIEYDEKILTKEKNLNEEGSFLYTIKDTDNKEDFSYMIEQQIYTNLKPKKIQSLQEVLKNTGIYSKDNKLDDWALMEYFANYVVFLVKNKNFIQVETWYEIE